MGRGMSACFLSPRVREFHAPGSEFNTFCNGEDIFILIGLIVLIPNNQLEQLGKQNKIERVVQKSRKRISV